METKKDITPIHAKEIMVSVLIKYPSDSVLAKMDNQEIEKMVIGFVNSGIQMTGIALSKN